jgi:sugar lactone lactonase YvrE
VQVGLNGIVVHPSNFLIVAHNTRGALYRVDLNDPKKIAKIEVDQFFPGADGMILEGNTLYLVQGKGTNKVFSLTSKDGWKTATVTAMTKLTDRFQNPTTLAMRGDRLFVLNARLNELADSTMGFSEKFSIQEVELQKSSK